MGPAEMPKSRSSGFLPSATKMDFQARVPRSEPEKF